MKKCDPCLKYHLGCYNPEIIQERLCAIFAVEPNPSSCYKSIWKVEASRIRQWSYWMNLGIARGYELGKQYILFLSFVSFFEFELKSINEYL
jgi:hypothetical protein